MYKKIIIISTILILQFQLGLPNTFAEEKEIQVKINENSIIQQKDELFVQFSCKNLSDRKMYILGFKDYFIYYPRLAQSRIIVNYSVTGCKIFHESEGTTTILDLDLYGNDSPQYTILEPGQEKSQDLGLKISYPYGGKHIEKGINELEIDVYYSLNDIPNEEYLRFDQIEKWGNKACSDPVKVEIK